MPLIFSMRTICLVVICFVLLAMTNKKYFTNSGQGNPIIGTWEWHSNADTFRVTLRYEPDFKTPDGESYSAILGTHSYIKNGVLIEQAKDAEDTRGGLGFTLFGLLNYDDKINMSFHDITKDKEGKVLLKIIPGQPNKMHWQLSSPSETVTINKAIKTGYSVPADLVLTRVQ